MKQITVTQLISTFFLFLFLSACTEAEVMGGDNAGQQQAGEVETTFKIEVTDSQSPVTRSITFTAKGSTAVDTLQTRSATDLPDAQEKKVAGLWIGQYDAAGNRLSNQYIESVTGTQVTAKLVAANNCNVRFVANAGNLGSINTEALLNAKTLPYASTADGRPSSNLFAMTGAWTGNITGTTSVTPPTIPTVTLTRLPAKITFTYKINGTGFSFTPTSVSLKNVPDCSQVGELITQLSSGITYGTYTGTISNKGATMYWYLPENMAGTATGSNAVNSEKEKTGQGVTNATYIELFGNAVQNGVEYKNVAFRFYPGKDANDYNMKRNDHYIMSIDLKGLDISDKRITVGAIPPITVSPEGNLPAAAGGSKEVQITSRAGVVWSLPLPQWLSATIDGQTTPPGSTLTNQGPCKVTFTTTETNPNSIARSKTFTVGMGDGTNQSFMLTQDPSILTISTSTLQLTEYTPTSGTVIVNGTPGLEWTITPAGEANGITPVFSSPITNGTDQLLTFNATDNPDTYRKVQFVISASGGDHSLTVIVKQPADPIITIKESTLQNYYAQLKTTSDLFPDYTRTWATHPPFDSEGHNQYHGTMPNMEVVPPTMIGNYRIQVQTTQKEGISTYAPAKKYCEDLDEDGHTDWRLPTMIELYAMWDKCRGENINATDGDEASQTLGALFISGDGLWSSSYFDNNDGRRCDIDFGNGCFFFDNLEAIDYVRCVRNK